MLQKLWMLTNLLHVKFGRMYIFLFITQEVEQTTFFTTPGLDDRLDVQASFKAISNSNIASGQTLGSFMLHYNLMFTGSEIQPEDGNSFSEYNFYDDNNIFGGDYFLTQVGGGLDLIALPAIQTTALSGSQIGTTLTGQFIQPGYYLVICHQEIYQYGGTTGTEFSDTPIPPSGVTITESEYYKGDPSSGDVGYLGTGAMVWMIETTEPYTSIPETMLTHLGAKNFASGMLVNMKLKVQRLAESSAGYAMQKMSPLERFNHLKKYKVRHGKANLVEQKLMKLEMLIEKLSKTQITPKKEQKEVKEINKNEETTNENLRLYAMQLLAKGNKDNKV